MWRQTVRDLPDRDQGGLTLEDKSRAIAAVSMMPDAQAQRFIDGMLDPGATVSNKVETVKAASVPPVATAAAAGEQGRKYYYIDSKLVTGNEQQGFVFDPANVRSFFMKPDYGTIAVATHSVLLPKVMYINEHAVPRPADMDAPLSIPDTVGTSKANPMRLRAEGWAIRGFEDIILATVALVGRALGLLIFTY